MHITFKNDSTSNGIATNGDTASYKMVSIREIDVGKPGPGTTAIQAIQRIGGVWHDGKLVTGVKTWIHDQ